MDEFKDKREYNNKIVLLILGVTTILVALIGASFAYFTAIINNVNGNQSVVITTTTVKGIVYDSSEPLLLLNALPGDSATSNFTVHNPNTNLVATYDMKLVTDSSTFEATEGNNQLILTISNGQLESPKVLDLTDGTDTIDKMIVKNIDLQPEMTDTYTVEMKFVDTDSLQNTNKGKTYVGHIEVIQSIITTRGE